MAVVIMDEIGPVVTLAEAEFSVTFDKEYPCAIRENTSAKTDIMMWQVLLRTASKVLAISSICQKHLKTVKIVFFLSVSKRVRHKSKSEIVDSVHHYD